MSFLGQAAIFLGAAVLMVPLFRRLNLGAVLGYLIAGVLIGPWGFALITDVESILHFSEFGVVLLLFIIGLELQPSRLWILRRLILGLGFTQVLFTSIAIALIARFMGVSWVGSIVAGLGLAMSSTAFALQTLAERNQLTSRQGREAFAILLFQDIAVIPILALMPSLSGSASQDATGGWLSAVKAIAVILGVVVGGRFLLRPSLRFVARLGNREIFTSAALLVVVGMSLLMTSLGLTASLGAFLAGVLLADSEFRHELEADIEPFKGLFLGLFFMAVGMSANMGLVKTQPLELLGAVAVFMLIKFSVISLIGKVSGDSSSVARQLAISLAQGGEFAFVLFGLAVSLKLLSPETSQFLIVMVIMSMVLAPGLFLLEDNVLKRFLEPPKAVDYDRIDEENPVVIAGFGRFAQIIARILTVRHIKFTALEKNPEQVEFVRRFGSKVYYGDASRLDLLRAAKVEKAKLFVLAVDDVEGSIKTAEMVRRHFPHVPIYARARNRAHSYRLLDLGVKVFYRDTYYSSLKLAVDVLEGLGFSSQDAERTVTQFEKYDEALLIRQHAIYTDEAKLLESGQQARIELENLFENDRTDTAVKNQR